MILIISREEDYTTQEVCKWLRYFEKNFVLINESNKILEIKIKSGEIKITTNYEEFSLYEVKSFWYRRGKFFFDKEECLDKQNYFDYKLLEEMRIVNDYLMSRLGSYDYFNKDLNKLVVLDIANELGFKTPKSLLTYQKDDLKSYFNGNRIITKTLGEVISYMDEENTYSSTTTEVKMDELEDHFHLSFFQQLIEKKYEIRTFVYNGKFYSSAIFSQLEEKTKIDYRNYDYTKLNRQVAYQLPASLEDKILKLLGKLNLTSGSIDFIYGVDHEYYFLEINPIGQFGMLSTVCNYYCEKEIATNL